MPPDIRKIHKVKRSMYPRARDESLATVGPGSLSFWGRSAIDSNGLVSARQSK